MIIEVPSRIMSLFSQDVIDLETNFCVSLHFLDYIFLLSSIRSCLDGLLLPSVFGILKHVSQVLLDFWKQKEEEREREGGGGEGRERVVKGCQECDREEGNNCKLCENSPHANPCLHA